MRTSVEYTKDTDKGHYVYFTVKGKDCESLFFNFVEFSEKYGFNYSGCPEESEDYYCDSFHTEKYWTKKEFMQEFRRCVRDWKRLSK